MKTKSFKTIDGIRFDIVGYGSKREMNDKATKIRKLGYNARVFYEKDGKYYTVYQSRKKRNWRIF